MKSKILLSLLTLIVMPAWLGASQPDIDPAEILNAGQNECLGDLLSTVPDNESLSLEGLFGPMSSDVNLEPTGWSRPPWNPGQCIQTCETCFTNQGCPMIFGRTQRCVSQCP